MGGIYQPLTPTHNDRWFDCSLSMEKYGFMTIHPAIYLRPEPLGFFGLAIYAPQLVSYAWLANSTQHLLVFLGSSVQLAWLVQMLDPWLCTTKQGLWPQPLPLVKQTICLGWLLFSAPEYNLEEIWRAILTATGVQVALHYQIIKDCSPVQAPCKPPQTKAIHIEVDSWATQNNCEQIGNVFSAKTKKFPVGKMQLVAEISPLTNDKAAIKPSSFRPFKPTFWQYPTYRCSRSPCIPIMRDTIWWQTSRSSYYTILCQLLWKTTCSMLSAPWCHGMNLLSGSYPNTEQKWATGHSCQTDGTASIHATYPRCPNYHNFQDTTKQSSPYLRSTCSKTPRGIGQTI